MNKEQRTTNNEHGFNKEDDMENIDRIKSIIEALLIVSEGGLTAEDLRSAIPDADMKDINEGIKLLKEEFDSPRRAFNIAEIAGRYRIVTKPEYMPWIGNLYKKEVDRLSGPALETLAILAYKQPATRAEIESVRGVNVGGVLKALLEKDLLQVKGRKEVIGRPLLYGTTGKFLEIFGLNSLEDLPILRDFTEEDLEYGKPQEVVEVEDGSTDDSSQSTGSTEPGAGSGEQGASVFAEATADKGSVEHVEEPDTRYPIPDTSDTDKETEVQEDIQETEGELPEAERIETEVHEPETITEANQDQEIAEEKREVKEEESDDSDQSADSTEQGASASAEATADKGSGEHVEELDTRYPIPDTSDTDKETEDEAEKTE
ncbi:MAG: SMC-Scp complex subunit ScpB [Candidatus Tantalella remota]|nr:SMC-Scp complex subunit ScpB [Candidatus Tantalella remota]